MAIRLLSVVSAVLFRYMLAGQEIQGAHAQQNSGQAIYSHTFNTQILFNHFIIIIAMVVTIIFIINNNNNNHVDNISSLACMTLHPQLNATLLLYLDDRA